MKTELVGASVRGSCVACVASSLRRTQVRLIPQQLGALLTRTSAPTSMKVFYFNGQAGRLRSGLNRRLAITKNHHRLSS